MKKIFLLLALFMLTINMVFASSFLTSVELKLSSLTGISSLDNSGGSDVSIRIQTTDGSLVVERNAVAGIYDAGDTIPMQGADFSLDYATDYVYNLSTTYGNFIYNFTTPEASTGDIGATIKSIQRVSFVINQRQSNTQTTSISSVNTSMAMMKYLGTYVTGGTGTDDREAQAQVRLVNSTTVEVRRSDWDKDTKTFFEVVEFNSGVKSIQRGTVELSSNPTDVSITAVNTSKAFVNLLGFTGGSQPLGCAVQLLDSDTLRFYKSGSTNGASYEVIEFE